MRAVPIFAIACVLFLFSSASFADDSWGSAPANPEVAAQEQKLRQLHWIKGPQKVQLFGNSDLMVPAGYVFLNPQDTAKLEELQHNLASGTQYFLARTDGSWEAMFSFSDDGYVKDNEKIDADAILKNIENNTDAANKARRERGWDEMEVTGWQTPPHYDEQTNRLEWAIAGKDVQTDMQVVNFNTRILGRGGVMSVVLIASPQALTASIVDFKTTLRGFEYQQGQRYAQYKPGDKLAKYGLAALITGGAAAVAVKTGLWKVLVGAIVAGWKVIIAGVAAVVAAFRKFFNRKTT